MDFYQHLNYSIGNEDWNVEAQALRVKPGDHVICVTASGDRPLHLLMTDCAAILSIDMNRIENHLLDLKLAAITHLDYETYLAFLGGTETPHRMAIFQQLKPHLSHPAARFWEDNKNMLEKGIIYQGKMERLTNITSCISQFCRNDKIQTLFSFTDLNEQREFVAKKWDSHVWRLLLSAILINPRISKLFITDPGLNSYTDYASNPGQYIYSRMLRYLNNHLANKSALLQLVFLGKILPSAYFPYLQFGGYTKIRRDPARLRYQTTNIIEFLHTQTAHEFNGFSLSDIASYMPQNIFERLLHGIEKSAHPGARFCLREFMSKRTIPPALQATFRREDVLEAHLEKEEVNFVYRFMVGTIQK